MKFTAAILVLFAGVIGGMTAANQQQEGERIFSLKVKQIFSSKCFACHGQESKKIKGEFDLTTRAGLLKGGESEEPGMVPGHPPESVLRLQQTSGLS